MVSHQETTRVQQAVRVALREHDCIVLAVSGGLDSMALLDAASSVVPGDRLFVATFDHGTGPAATAARQLVEIEAARRGIECVAERTNETLRGEAELRSARWRFLEKVGARFGARICTAHTEDDQLETILMRVLRGAGPRGLAALYANRPVLRPFLGLTRRDLVAYARRRGLRWQDDPSNGEPLYLRNRIRHDLLPALRQVRPTIGGELLALGWAAAAWRCDVERLAEGLFDSESIGPGEGMDVPAEVLASSPASHGEILWPAIAARWGLVLDRRGIARLSAFGTRARVGARIQLAGGWEVVRSRQAFQFRRSGEEVRELLVSAELSPDRATTWSQWTFVSRIASDADGGPWTAFLPVDEPLRVRGWMAGDSMVCRQGGSPRKVKRLLSDARITGHQRATWPVVLAGDRIVWIPGVRRADAATARPGWPGLPFACEYIHR